MKVENPEMIRKNVCNTFKESFDISDHTIAKNIEISIKNYFFKIEFTASINNLNTDLIKP